jgi:hypothetical protein
MLARCILASLHVASLHSCMLARRPLQELLATTSALEAQRALAASAQRDLGSCVRQSAVPVVTPIAVVALLLCDASLRSSLRSTLPSLRDSLALLSFEFFCCTLRRRLNCRQGLVATSCMLLRCIIAPSVICQTACDAERVGGQRGGRARRGGSAATVSASTPPTWPHAADSCSRLHAAYRKLSASLNALHRAACRSSCRERAVLPPRRFSCSSMTAAAFHAAWPCLLSWRVSCPRGTHYLVARGSTGTHYLVARGSTGIRFARCSTHACSVHP